MQVQLFIHKYKYDGETENLTRFVNKHVVEDNAVETPEYVHLVVMDNCGVAKTCYAVLNPRLIKNVPLSTLCMYNSKLDLPYHTVPSSK